MKENIPGYPGYHITKDGKSKRHINKIVSQYKSGIRWDNNLI